jgi:formylglycine-generating enzyme required for sulfatase activity
MEFDIMNVKKPTFPSKQIAWGLGAPLFLLLLTACGGGGGGGGSADGNSGPAGPVAFNDCPGGDTSCPAMVLIPAGSKNLQMSFQMGSPENEPGHRDNETQHEVTFAYSFAAGKYPVTVGQWKAFIAANPAHSNNYAGCEAVAPDDNHPVVCVTWNDAQDYAEWLSGKTGKTYRLLSEAEWEYAARAGTTTPYPFSASLGVSDVVPRDDLEFANYANAAGDHPGTLDLYYYTTPVGTFPANLFGLYDMNGNVWEWTEDCYVANYMDANVPKDGTANTSGACAHHVMRGGSWGSDPEYLRSAYRLNNVASTSRGANNGFRVARDLPALP